MLQATVTTMLALAAGLGALKVIDQVALIILMIRSTAVGLDAPVFRWFRRRVSGRGRTAQVAQLAGDQLFRAPTIVVLGAVAVALAGQDHTDLQVLVGCLMVAVADNIVAVALIAELKERKHGGDSWGISGFHRTRTHDQPRDQTNALDPIVVGLMTTASIVLAYSAGYRSLSVAHPHSFFVDGAPHTMTLADSVYFSVLGSTIGFNDISTRGDGAELLIVSHVVMIFVVLAFFVKKFVTVADRAP